MKTVFSAANDIYSIYFGTKYGECEWDGLWSVKWMRWEWMSWTLVYKWIDELW